MWPYKAIILPSGDRVRSVNDLLLCADQKGGAAILALLDKSTAFMQFLLIVFLCGWVFVKLPSSGSYLTCLIDVSLSVCRDFHPHLLCCTRVFLKDWFFVLFCTICTLVQSMTSLQDTTRHWLVNYYYYILLNVRIISIDSPFHADSNGEYFILCKWIFERDFTFKVFYLPTVAFQLATPRQT